MPLKIASQGQKSLVWNGSFFVHHSLAHVNRELLLALLDDPDFNASFLPFIDHYEPATFTPEGDHGTKLLEIQNRLLPEEPTLTLRHRWPPDWCRPRHGKLIVIQPWEYGAIPADWVTAAQQPDEIWAYSTYVRDCYLRAGIPSEKVFVVPCGINPNRFYPNRPPLDLVADPRFSAIQPDTFVFLFVGGTIPRKGIDILLEAWQRAFTPKDDVALIIKDFGVKSFYRGQTLQEQIARLQASGACAPIFYLDEDLSDEQIAALYASCHCLVHPYRGEGYALPVAEAMACGKPVIVTGEGAALDFASNDNAYLIPATIEYFPEARIGDIPTFGLPFWAKPDGEALVELLRRVASNREEARERGLCAAQHMAQNHTWAHAARIALSRLKAVCEQPSQAEILPFGLEALPLDAEPDVLQSTLDWESRRKSVLQRAREGQWESLLPEIEACLQEQPEDADLCNALALCYFYTGNHQKAVEVLELAVTKHPNSRDLHHNLAYFLLMQGRGKEALPHALAAFRLTPGELQVRKTLERCARWVLQEARKRLRAVPSSRRHTVKSSEEYRQLMRAYQEAQKALDGKGDVGRPRLSLCMIVKNEARFLANCLQSAKDVVDEIIVVDTGSTDETPQIARSFGAKVIEHVWKDDFSEARNVSIQHATGNWALWLDADEEIAPNAGIHFRNAIEKAPADVGGYMVKIRNWLSSPQRNEQGEVVVHHGVRLFRLVPGVRFEGRVHEQNMLSLTRLGYKTASYEGLVFDHYGYAHEIMQERNKHERFIRMLEHEVAECQDATLRPFQLFNLGNAYFTQNDMANAVRYFEQAAAEASPQHEYSYILFYEWALALHALGHFQQALEVCRHAESLKIEHSGLSFAKGQCFLALERYQEAEAAFSEAIKLGTQRKNLYAEAGDLGLGSYKAYYALALALRGQERYEEALDCCKKALELRPGMHEARHLMAQMLQKLGRKEEARNVLEMLLEHLPTNEMLVRELAELLMELEDYEEAYIYWQRAALRQPDATDVLAKFASCCEHLQRWEEALELYLRLNAQGCETPEVYVNLGRVLTALNRIAEAVDCYAEAIRVGPAYGNAYFNAGDLLYKLGCYDRAADVYAAGLQVEPQRRSGFFVLGNCYFQLRAYEAAILAYRQELALHPDHAEAQHNLALAEAMLTEQTAA
ncbi:glycosyltransferase [Chthonomonas calidirosea]|uniref:Glycosyltransferase n=1 Tax=Chthonomonas calidirosea (strain DSM 23976 / ICMP 18418 / T49) TaxID=1303518 RepID=S0EZG8_CHTCT|nr:tetratricopeptide repeat protein [Chthonomonas calidirosea]CCW35787.1 Glycosyltransferase [Chthonomonas calidirosea T49]CEK19242.1 glycosyltransferase [Chthonomonas calidirosea]